MNETQILDFKMLVGEKLSFPSGAGGGRGCCSYEVQFMLNYKTDRVQFMLNYKQIDQEEW